MTDTRDQSLAVDELGVEIRRAIDRSVRRMNIEWFVASIVMQWLTIAGVIAAGRL